jgi:hypothetical protein
MGVSVFTALGTSDSGFSGQDVFLIQNWKENFSVAVRTLQSQSFQITSADGSMTRIESKDPVTGKITYTLQQKTNDVVVRSELGATIQDVIEMKTYAGAFNTTQTLQSHFWQLDINGDGSALRIKSISVVNGVEITGKVTFTEKLKLAFVLFRIQLVGTSTLFTASDDVFDIRVWATAFNDASASHIKKSEVWQITTADGAVTRTRQQEFVNGVAGKITFSEQSKANTAKPELLAAGETSSQDAIEVKSYSNGFNLTQILTAHVWKLDVLGDGSLVRIKQSEVVNGVETGKVTYMDQRKLRSPVSIQLGAAGPTDVLEIKIFDKGINDSSRKLLSHGIQLDLKGDGSVIRMKSYEVVNGVETGKVTFTEQALKLPTDVDFKGSPLGTSLIASDPRFIGQPIYYFRSWNESFSATPRTLTVERYQVLSLDQKTLRMISRDPATGEITYLEQTL